MYANLRYRKSAVFGGDDSSESVSLGSVVSLALPPLPAWGLPRSRAPTLDSRRQLVEFLACLAATTVLAVGVLCAATGCWVLPAKLALCRVVDAWRLPLCAALMLLAGALAGCLAALACLSQHGQGYWMFILSLASLALVMLVGGAWQTVEQRAALAFVPAAQGARQLPPPAAPLPAGLALVPGATRDTMAAVMHAALSRYATDLRYSWDTLQKSLQCCGVDNYSDWLNIQDSVPCSCLPTEDCSSTSYFTQGCLDVAALDLAATSSFLCGFISVAITTLALVLLLATWRYAAERNIHPLTPRMSS